MLASRQSRRMLGESRRAAWNRLSDTDVSIGTIR